MLPFCSVIQFVIVLAGFPLSEKWPGWPWEHVFRMLIPAQKVGYIIGRKGEHIKKLSEETKARIKILDGPPGTSERAVSFKLNFLEVICISYRKG